MERRPRRRWLSGAGGGRCSGTGSFLACERQQLSTFALIITHTHSTVTSSSRLIVSVFACRTWPHADLPLHGAVVIPLESLRAISLQSFDLIVHPTGTTTLVLSIDLPGTSSQHGRVLGEAGGSGAPPDVSMEDQVHSAEVASSSAKKAMDNLKGTKDSISQTMQIADKAPGDLEEVVGLYDTWAPALNNVKQVVDIVDKIAEIHPWAKMAWSILSCIPKTFIAQVERDASFGALQIAIRDAFDLAKLGWVWRSSSQQRAGQDSTEDVHIVCECGDLIQNYAKRQTSVCSSHRLIVVSRLLNGLKGRDS
ncbi:hypothetical protein BC834DRAFT_892688 [Gloeopeniophorella convolvens]|nr:hypothetical protein BC834DRAFT_892688 [Gloeopeniophorella convolvens]